MPYLVIWQQHGYTSHAAAPVIWATAARIQSVASPTFRGSSPYTEVVMMTDRESRVARWTDGGDSIKIFKREESQCWSCRNRVQGGGWTCRAYPSGIPMMLVKNLSDHKLPFIGDNGIRWESLDQPNGQDIIF